MSTTTIPSHTPGPWKVDGADITDSRGTPVALRYADAGAVEADMNGHLIASAPELLAACLPLAEWLGHFRDTGEQLGNLDMRHVDTLRAAIAKATGR